MDYPENYEFDTVNDFVHNTGRQFEELQFACIGAAEQVTKLLGLLADIKKWDCEQAGDTFRKCGDCLTMVIPQPLRKRMQDILEE